MTSHGTGLLIIRAWKESGSTRPLRAHVRVIDDVSVAIESTVTVVEPDEVGELVGAWLQKLLGTD